MHDPLMIFGETDKAFYELIGKNRELAFAEGEIPLKNKLLIAIALDSSKGAVGGVKSLAMQALKEGASKEEIIECIRIANFICGVVTTYTAAEALKDVF